MFTDRYNILLKVFALQNNIRACRDIEMHILMRTMVIYHLFKLCMIDFAANIDKSSLFTHRITINFSPVRLKQNQGAV